MHTTKEYLDQLEKDKATLVKNLTAMGVPSYSNIDTFTSLSSKVLEIPFMIYEGWNTELDISNFDLPKEAIVTMFNRLADLKQEGLEEKEITLGTINSTKLSVSEMNIATNKGWNIYF